MTVQQTPPFAILGQMNRLRLLFAGLLFSGISAASVITVTGVDAPTGYQQQVWLNLDGTDTQQFWVGGIDMTIDGYARLVWCVDLFTDIYMDTYNSNLNWADTPSLQRVAWLIENV